jgi:hypothetical protein
MSKRTKQSLGKLVETTASESVEHLMLTSTTAKANTLADVQEDFSERGIDLAELKGFQTSLFSAFEDKPTHRKTPNVQDS